MNLVLLLALLGPRAYGEGWEKPRYFHPDKCENYTFRDGAKGLKVEYTLKRSNFNGKVPETIDLHVFGPLPVEMDGYDDEEDLRVVVCHEERSWHIIHHMSNDDITGPVFRQAGDVEMHPGEGRRPLYDRGAATR